MVPMPVAPDDSLDFGDIDIMLFKLFSYAFLDGNFPAAGLDTIDDGRG